MWSARDFVPNEVLQMPLLNWTECRIYYFWIHARQSKRDEMKNGKTAVKSLPFSETCSAATAF